MPPSPPLPPAVEVFRNNRDGYPFFRIPSLLHISTTLLLAFAEARKQKTDHGHVDIVLKKSNFPDTGWPLSSPPPPPTSLLHHNNNSSRFV